jgi:hypothetical protein
VQGVFPQREALGKNNNIFKYYSFYLKNKNNLQSSFYLKNKNNLQSSARARSARAQRSSFYLKNKNNLQSSF